MHHHFGGGHHFHQWHPYGGHPRFASCPFFSGDADASEEEQAVAALFGKDKSRWDESDTHYTFQMDVPGVKAHQVTIEEKDGEIEVAAIRTSGEEVTKTYQDVFYIRPSKSDLSGLVATLNEGVLMVTVPKKNQEPLALAVEAGSAPNEAAEGQEFRFSMDLPGVKLADIKVQVHEEKIHLEASRNVGERNMLLRRTTEVNDPANTDMSQARAFLGDGVFTMIASITSPAAMEEDAASKPGAVKTFYVQEFEDVAEAALESLTLDDKNQKDKEGSMVVETVTEDKDWEDVKEEDQVKKMD